MPAADEVAQGVASAPKKWQLGIVLVHGIGDHKQGETLLQFGEPLLECVHRRVWSMWKRADADPKLAFEEHGPNEAKRYFNELLLGAKLSAYVDQSMPIPIRRLLAENANAEIKVSVPHIESTLNADGKRLVTRKVLHWNVQETWWGEQVIEPKAGDVIGWMMTRAPWIIGQFFYERFANRVFRSIPADAVRFIGYATCAAFAALAIQIIFLGFALASLIPIVSRWVGPALLQVAGVLGDAYVLIVQDLQHAAIVERVHDTLKSMRPQCDKVVVIAHSQGSGVLFDALATKTEFENWTPDHIITFGAGVAKLKTLFYAESREPWTMQVAGWCAFLGALVGIVVSVLSVWLLKLPWIHAGAVGVAAFVVFSFVIAKFSLFPCYVRCRRVFEYKQGASSVPNASGASVTEPSTWTDFAASHDPVPMGRLGVRGKSGEQTVLGYLVTAHRIWNERSWLSDHVTYADNKAEFCAPIVELLLNWSGANAALRHSIPSNVRETHRTLSLIRGIFEHLIAYAIVAALPWFDSKMAWMQEPFVRAVSGTVKSLCTAWLPELISAPICGKSSAELSEGFVRLSWSILALIAYALALSGLAIMQRWWRAEIANRALQDKALKKGQHWGVVVCVAVLYLMPLLALFCFFIGPWDGRYPLAAVFVAVSSVPLAIGFWLALESALNRKKDFQNASAILKM